MSTPILRENIIAGDTIRATEVGEGVKVERTGTVEDFNTLNGAIWTADGGTIHHAAWSGDWKFELLDRPKPPFPTAAGRIIIATFTDGRMEKAILHSSGRWEYLYGGVVNLNHVASWTLAKVVPA